MEIHIRNAAAEDMPAVLELINELAVYEKEPDAVEVTVAELMEDGFGKSPLFHCFVAQIQDEICGMALVYPRYSTWKGPVIHLEDLIVRESHRGQGIGSLLLDEVVKYGHQRGVKRISWEVLDWNEPAIRFYEEKGAHVMRDWDVVQLDEAGIRNYIEKL